MFNFIRGILSHALASVILGAFSAILPMMIIVFLAYQNGYTKGIAVGDQKISQITLDWQSKYNKLLQENQNISNHVITKYITQTKVITQKEYINENNANNLNDTHLLSNGWVYIHNSAATDSASDSTRASDETASTVTNSQALGTIVDNYSICYQNAAQLKALQDWINKVRSVDNTTLKK